MEGDAADRVPCSSASVRYDATAMSNRNRYLVTPSGRFVGDRTVPALIFVGLLVLAPLLGVLGATVGSLLDLGIVVALSLTLASLLFLGAVIAQWVFLLGGASSVARATQAVMAGDTVSPIALCQTPLGRVFRADVRTRALHALGLCAEANGDFAEAADLFERAMKMIPALAAGRYQRHARVLMLCHRALALVALRRLDEADLAVRQASLLFPPRAPGALDLLTDDAAFGALGVAGALRDIEQGRDPRALLTLASVVVLAARGMGREAVELVERERYFLNAGLLPRERALVTRVEGRAHRQLGAGPLRSAAVVAVADPASEAWADRVLPLA
jgi:Tetratricopeptide repeat